MEHDIEIILVVFDKKAFELSGKLVGEIDSYIDANYVKDSHEKEYPLQTRRSIRIRKTAEKEFQEELLEDNMDIKEESFPKDFVQSTNGQLEDQLANIGESFHEKLFELINEAHLDNKDVWKRANLDRKHFSKI